MEIVLEFMTPSRSLLIICALVPFLLLDGCKLLSPGVKMREGVVTEKQPDGSILLTATGKASDLAIKRKKSVMMRTTSCDAANTMIKSEIVKLTGKRNVTENSYSITDTETFRDGEFCRIRATFPSEL